jgi:glycosyltransferase involved in cell wall biosynthesis
MSCGLPAIIADDPGTDYLAGTADADMFRRGDARALAAVLARSSDSSPGRRGRIADFCRRHFDWLAIARESIAIYREAGRTLTSRP